jgi:hypothetical protein
MPFEPRHRRPFVPPPRRGPPPPPPELDGEVGPLPPGETGTEATAKWASYQAPPVWCEKHPDRQAIAFIHIGRGQWGGLCEECRRRYPAPMVGKYAPPEPPPAQPDPDDEPPF